MTEIKRIDNLDTLVSFYEASPHSPFVSLKWTRLLSKGLSVQHYGIYLDDKLTGAFPLFFRSGKVLTAFTAPPLTPHTGIVIKPEDLNQEIIDEILKFFSLLKCDTFYFAFPPDQSEMKIAIPGKLKPKNHRTYILDLKLPVEKLYDRLRSDKKRSIKKCQKPEIRISFEKNPLVIKELIRKTYVRQQKENNWAERVPELVDKFEDSFQVTVYENEIPGCSLFFVTGNGHAYYIFGGIDDSLDNYNLGPFAMWNGILKAKELELNTFDFEGSEIPSIEKYFQSFGSVRVDYPSFEKTSIKYKFLKWIS